MRRLLTYIGRQRSGNDHDGQDPWSLQRRNRSNLAEKDRLYALGQRD